MLTMTSDNWLFLLILSHYLLSIECEEFESNVFFFSVSHHSSQRFFKLLKMRVVLLLAMVLVLSVRTKCEDELMMLDVYEMYGSPISEKTSVESSVMLRYNGNVSFTSLCQGRAIGYTESRLENSECFSLDGVSNCSGNDRDGVVISLNTSKTIQFGSSASDEIVACAPSGGDIFVVGVTSDQAASLPCIYGDCNSDEENAFVARVSSDMNVMQIVRFGSPRQDLVMF